MKRIGKAQGLIDEITSNANLELAIDTVLRTRQRKGSRYGRLILRHREEVKERLRNEIRSGEFFANTTYREYEVKDSGKMRRIQCVNTYKRIGCSAVMGVVEEYVRRRYIRTTCSSIRNRGMHDLLNYIRKDIALFGEEMQYAYKYDVRKFYESINQDFMMYALRRMFKDKILLTILERFVRMMPNGLSIGLRSSQAFGNMLLSMFLDHYLKDQCGIKHFYRYCDDGDHHDKSKKELWRQRELVHQRIESIGLAIKPNERIFPITEGLDFLGYVIYPDHTMLRKRIKQNAARHLHKVKSRRRRVQLLGSLYGYCKHGNCRNLFKTLSGMSMDEYKRLKDLHIKPKYVDGKKRFDCSELNLCDLVGEEFLILDFETDIVTSPQRKDYERAVERATERLQTYRSRGQEPPCSFIYPEDIPMPKGKHLMHIKRLSNDKEFKVYTGDRENYSILEQLREIGFPVLASVEAIKCKGFTRYRLC